MRSMSGIESLKSPAGDFKGQSEARGITNGPFFPRLTAGRRDLFGLAPRRDCPFQVAPPALLRKAKLVGLLVSVALPPNRLAGPPILLAEIRPTRFASQSEAGGGRVLPATLPSGARTFLPRCFALLRKAKQSVGGDHRPYPKVSSHQSPDWRADPPPGFPLWGYGGP